MHTLNSPIFIPGLANIKDGLALSSVCQVLRGRVTEGQGHYTSLEPGYYVNKDLLSFETIFG